MSNMHRLQAAAAALVSMGLGIGLAWADGTSSGRIISVGEKDVRVLVPTERPLGGPDAKKKVSSTSGTTYIFQYTADTDVLVGDQKMKVADLQKGWQVTVNWSQDPLVDDGKRPAVKPVTPFKQPGGSPVDPKTGTVLPPTGGVGTVAPKNKNPMIASRFAAATTSKEVQFVSFEGTDAMNIAYEEETKSANPKAKAKKTVVKAAARLHPNFKVFIEGQEVDRGVLTEGAVVKGEIIDDGGRVPLLLKVVGKKDAVKK